MSLDGHFAKFLGGLYEAVSDADEWRSAMAEVVRRSESCLAVTTTVDQRRKDIVDIQFHGCGETAADIGAREYVDGMASVDPVLSWVHQHPGAGRCESASVIPESGYRDQEIVKWSHSRFGATHWNVFYTEPVDGLSYVMTFFVRAGDGRQTRKQLALQELLFENLERAIRLAARPPNFASDDSALIAVDSSGRPLSRSPRAEDLLRSTSDLVIRDGVLTARDDHAARLLARALRSVMDPESDEPPGRAIRIAGDSGKPDLLVVVSALPYGLDHVPRPVPTALVRLIELETRPAFLREHAHLFDLTPREIEIATSLLEGHSIESLSASLNVSRNTARNHIQALFRKTGTNRQSELVRMLDRLARQ